MSDDTRTRVIFEMRNVTSIEWEGLIPEGCKIEQVEFILDPDEPSFRLTALATPEYLAEIAAAAASYVAQVKS